MLRDEHDSRVASEATAQRDYAGLAAEHEEVLSERNALLIANKQLDAELDSARNVAAARKMIEVICNDRLGKKIRVKCNEDDTIGDLKKLVAAQSGTRPEKIRIQKWYTIFKDHITLEDYEIHDGMGLELYYN